MKQWLQRIMAGRYGTDSLNNVLSVITLPLLIAYFCSGWMIFYLLAFLLLACSLFRSLSRNLWKRGRENQAYLLIKGKATTKLQSVFIRLRQRKTHRFYKCKTCRTTLRVPKGRGKLSITCPKCHQSFIAKS